MVRKESSRLVTGVQVVPPIHSFCGPRSGFLVTTVSSSLNAADDGVLTGGLG